MRFLCVLLLVGLVATPSSEPDGQSLVGAGETRQTLSGASQERGTSPARFLPRHDGDAPLATRITGTATWCAPTPRYCHGWGGKAMLAAVPSFRYGDEPYTIQVTGFHGGKSNSVLVTVVSYCDCGSTVVDLSPYAFRQLAPLSVGRIRVIVDHVRGRAVPLAPATDVP